MDEKDGGPAFPTGGYEGASLKDLFSAFALLGLIVAHADKKTSAGVEFVRSKDAPGNLGFHARQYADAMLKAREQEDG